jgi:integrase
MSGRQAKTLSKDSCDDLLVFASTTRHPLRDRLIVLLSVKAGLRAAEIANLTWEMVLTPTSEIGPTIELHDRAAKKSGGRLIPIHPDLGEALRDLRGQTKGAGPVIHSQRGGPMTPVSIVNWFAKAYREIGLQGCSSHSGRRTFITRAARLVHNRCLVARRSTSRRSSFDTDHPAVYRR